MLGAGEQPACGEILLHLFHTSYIILALHYALSPHVGAHLGPFCTPPLGLLRLCASDNSQKTAQLCSLAQLYILMNFLTRGVTTEAKRAPCQQCTVLESGFGHKHGFQVMIWLWKAALLIFLPSLSMYFQFDLTTIVSSSLNLINLCIIWLILLIFYQIFNKVT